jgi:hypothetical protein
MLLPKPGVTKGVIPNIVDRGFFRNTNGYEPVSGCNFDDVAY